MNNFLKINWKTNYNKKLHCDIVWHIDLPPKNEITMQKMDELVIEISVQDNSIEPQKFKLIGYHEIRLDKPIGNPLCYISHGMTEKQLIDHLFNKYPNSMTNSNKLGLYIYQKI